MFADNREIPEIIRHASFVHATAFQRHHSSSFNPTGDIDLYGTGLSANNTMTPPALATRGSSFNALPPIIDDPHSGYPEDIKEVSVLLHQYYCFFVCLYVCLFACVFAFYERVVYLVSKVHVNCTGLCANNTMTSPPLQIRPTLATRGSLFNTLRPIIDDPHSGYPEDIKEVSVPSCHFCNAVVVRSILCKWLFYLHVRTGIFEGRDCVICLMLLPIGTQAKLLHDCALCFDTYSVGTRAES